MCTIGGLGWYIGRYIGRQSTNMSPDRRLKVVSTDTVFDRRYSADTWPIRDRYLTDTRPSFDRHLTNSSSIHDRCLTDTWPTLDQYFSDTSLILHLEKLFHDKRYKPLISGACRLRQRIPSNVFIMGYVTLSLGCCMGCFYNCFFSSRLCMFISILVLRPSLRP